MYAIYRLFNLHLRGALMLFNVPSDYLLSSE
jgi:hypothetical protein